jgi:hypothetical protein
MLNIFCASAAGGQAIAGGGKEFKGTNYSHVRFSFRVPSG